MAESYVSPHCFQNRAACHLFCLLTTEVIASESEAELFVVSLRFFYLRGTDLLHDQDIFSCKKKDMELYLL